MSLRSQTLAFTSLILAALMMVVHLFLGDRLLTGFRQAERQETVSRTNEVARLIARQLDGLDSLCHDWACWDDTLEFATTGKKEFIRSNLTSEAITILRAQAVMVTDRTGRLRFGEWYDDASRSAGPPPPELASALRPGGALWPEQRHGSRRTGLLATRSRGLLMVVARPVFNSHETGAAGGAIAFARAADRDEIVGIAGPTGLAVAVRGIGGGLPEDFQQALSALGEPGAVRAVPLGAGTVAGYTLLADLGGKPAAILRVTQPRVIYNQGLLSLRYMRLPLVSFGLILSAVLLLFLEHRVLLRLTALGSDVQRITASGDVTSRLAVQGRDELAQLAGLVNGMLAGLQQSENERRRSEEVSSAITENLPMGVLLVGKDLRVVVANPKMRSWFPALEQAQGLPCYRTLRSPTQQQPCEGCRALLALSDGRLHETEGEFQCHPEGSRKYRVITVPIRDAMGNITSCLNLVEDVTYHRHLEESLREAAKTEAIGRLAGGIAHDFNNLLTVITMELELEEMRSGPSAVLQRVRQAAERAASLTAQLLAFGRRQPLQAKVTNLNAAVEGAAQMLSRLLGDDVEVVIRTADDLWNVTADPSQAEQIIVNLATNARDAMPTGGRLLIETYNVSLDGEYAAMHYGMVPGDYAVVAVSDTGHGMDGETLSHVFEPYFTSKRPGRGTGLGLAVVSSVVSQSGGYTHVYSEPGLGTTFKTYLPRSEEEFSEPEGEAASTATALAPATVLVVEDEAELRELATQCLTAAGVRVIMADDAPHALELAETEGRIDLLFTDVVMPQMSGPQLADMIRPLQPEMPVLFTSGYTDDMVLRHGVETGEVHLLAKPYTRASLLSAVGRALETSHGKRA